MARPVTRRGRRPATETVSEAAPARAELRGPMREDDPRARAAKRAAELRDHLGGMEEGEDRFYVDPADIPEGWEYEWKRHRLLGAEDPAYQVNTARRGWEAVPASRHPSFMPEGGRYATIERDGLVLMERPKEIGDEARALEQRKARAQVRQKEEQLSSAPQGQFERQNKDAPLVRVKKSYEPMPIPEA